MPATTNPQAKFPVPQQWKVTFPLEKAGGTKKGELAGDFVLGLKIHEEQFLLWSVTFAPIGGVSKLQLSARRDDEDQAWLLTLEFVGGKETPLWESEPVFELSGEIALAIQAQGTRSPGGLWPHTLSVMALAMDSGAGAGDPGEFRALTETGTSGGGIAGCCVGHKISGCVVQFDKWNEESPCDCSRLVAPITMPASGVFCGCMTVLNDFCGVNLEISAGVDFNPKDCEVTLNIAITGIDNFAGYMKTYPLDSFDPYAMNTIQAGGLHLNVCGPPDQCHIWNATIQFMGPPEGAPPERANDCWNIFGNCVKCPIIPPRMGEPGTGLEVYCCGCECKPVDVPGTDGPEGGDGCPNCKPTLNTPTGALSLSMSSPNTGVGNIDGAQNYNSVSGWSSLLNEYVSGDASSELITHKCTCDNWYYACPTPNSEMSLRDTSASVKYRSFGRNPNRLIATYTPGGLLHATEIQANGLEYDFSGLADSGGGLYRIRKPLGPTQAIWTIVRGSDIATIIDPASQRTTYVYAPDGMRVVDPYDRITSYTYDGSGNIATHVTPELCTTQYRYDGSNRVTAVIASDSTRTTYGYDANGWASKIHYPTGERYTYTYVNQFLTKVFAPGGAVTTLIHDNNRNITSATTPAGVQTQYRYDSTTKMTERIEPNGARTTYLYTATSEGVYRQSGEVTGNGTTTFRYSDDGVVSAVINPLNQRTTYVLDGTRIMATIDPLGHRTTNVYSASTGLNIATINPLGRRTTSVYNGLNQVVATIDPLGNRASYTYVNGQRTVVKDPLSRRTTTVYDLANKVLATIAPYAARTSYLYDAGCRQLATIYPAGYRTTNVYSAGRLIATIDPFSKRTTFAFDSRGNRIRVTDPLGNITTTLYDSSNRPIAQINPILARMTTVYDSSGRPKASIDPLGKRTTRVFDALNRPIASIDPLTFRTSTVYDKLDREVAQIDQLGNRTTTVYNANRRQIAVIDALGRRNTTTYNAASERLAGIDPLGHRTTNVYDAAGRQAGTINPLGNRASMVYNAASQLLAQLDPLGNRTTSVFDAAGRTVASIDPLLHRSTTVYDIADRTIASIDRVGNRTTYAYDATRRTRVTDARGNITTTLYDAVGRMLATIDALANRATTVYDAAGRTRATIDPLARRTTGVFDAASRRIATINPLGNRTTQSYDAAGRDVATIDPLGHRMTMVYDAASQVLATINGLGFRTTQTYDATGQRYRTIDPNAKITTSVYDAAGRTVATINPLGYRTTTVLDGANQRIALIDPNGGRNSFTYDKIGHRTQLIDPLGRRTTSAYDTAGRQTLRIDARAFRTTYAFDANDRQTGRKYPDGTRATFVYDAGSNRTTMHDSSGRTTFTYDELSRRTRLIRPSGTRLTYAFDAASQPRRLQVPSGIGIMTYVYDAAGMVRYLRDPQNRRTTFAYDAAGRRTVKRLGNGTRASFTYDDADQITQLANITSAAVTISSYAYRYDNVGNRTSVVEADGSRVTWLYDNAYQLSGENRTGTSGYRNTFIYDSRGNRTLKDESGTRTTTVYDAANQIVYSQAATGRTTYTFDAAGNQRVVREPSGARTTTVWDYENQQAVSIPPSPAVRTTMVYNADHQRVQKRTAGGANVNFYWDDQRFLAEANTSDSINFHYVSEPAQYGNVISSRRTGNLFAYHHYDALGSTRQLTDNSQAITDTWIYDAWGKTLARTGTSPVFLQWIGELGYYFDIETGLIDVRRRPYGPAIGRWGTVDPLSFSRVVGTSGLICSNRYLYSFNRPQLIIDASGMVPGTLIFEASDFECRLCGFAKLKWKIRAAAGHPANDFPIVIVQKITVHALAQECMFNADCRCGPIKSYQGANCTVYEFLKTIGADELKVGKAIDPDKVTPAEDTWASPFDFTNACSSKGTLKIKSEVRAFKDTNFSISTEIGSSRAGWNPSATVKCGVDNPTANVKAVAAKLGPYHQETPTPQWWNDQKKWLDSGVMTMYVDWGCCNNDYIQFAGWASSSTHGAFGGDCYE